MSHRESYIAILNKFKKGKIHLSRHKVLIYLAAIKLDMVLWNKKDLSTNADLISLDHTKIAKINSRDNVSRIVMPFSILPTVRKFIIVSEFDNPNYEIVKLNYDEELSNVPVDLFTTHDINKLKLENYSQVLYLPKVHTFIESDITKCKIKGILVINNCDSMVIIAKDKYYTCLINSVGDYFRKFTLTRKDGIIKIKINHACNFRCLLETIVDNIK